MKITNFLNIFGLSLLATCLSCIEAKAEQALPVVSTTNNCFFVSPSGNDSNPGTAQQPFKTITYAANNPGVTAGTTIWVGNGSYNEPNFYCAAGGNANSPTGYVTICAQNRGQAKVIAPTGISIIANYIVLDGLDVSGASDYAVGVLSPQNFSQGVHHVQVLNCTLHDNGGGGIGTCFGDIYNFSGNYIYNNCATNPSQTSGISVWMPNANQNYTSTWRDLSPQYHITITSNGCYRNTETSAASSATTDGEGIILDTISTATNYNQRILVASNFCYQNGGRGIQVLGNYNPASGVIAPVDVVNNTCISNNLDTNDLGNTTRGEFLASGCAKVNFLNNIAYAYSTSPSSPWPSSVYSNNTAFVDDQVNSPFSPKTVDTWLHNIGYNPNAGAQNNSGMYPGPTSTYLINPVNNLLCFNPQINASNGFPNNSQSVALTYGLSAAYAGACVGLRSLPLISIPDYTGYTLTPGTCGAFDLSSENGPSGPGAAMYLLNSGAGTSAGGAGPSAGGAGPGAGLAG